MNVSRRKMLSLIGATLFSRRPEESGVPSYFQLFIEIGIFEQLSRTSLQSPMPDGVLVSLFTVLNHLVRVQDGCTPREIASAFQIPNNHDSNQRHKSSVVNSAH